MKLASGLALSAGAAFGLFGLLSIAAATPPVLDKVPKNALAVIGVPSPEKLQKNIASLADAVDLPFPIPAVDDILAQMGAEKGVDKSKSLAIVILPPANGAKNKDGSPITEADMDRIMEEGMFVLMPTTNYAEFIGNFEAKNDAGIDAGLIEGDEAYFRDLGNGYAAMSPTRDVLARIDAKAANKAAIDTALGSSGVAVADSADVFLMINLDEARVFQPLIMEQMKAQMEGNPAALALEGIDQGAAADMLKQLADQAQTMIIGLRPDAMGVALDAAWAFKAGSDMARTFDGKGTTASLLQKLPNQPYFFAMAMDLSTPGMRSLVDRFSAMLTKDGEGGLPAMFAEQLKASDGAAVTVGSPQGGLMGGILTSTISYLRTSKPDGYVAAMRQGLTDLNGQAMGPMTMSSSFTPDGGEVDGNKVDSYAVKFTASDEEDADPQIGMAMQMIFGSSRGPGGYIAKVNGGVLQTYSKNSLLLGAGMKAAGGGDSLAADKTLAQVGQQLPKDRMFELYIGIKSILEAALPLAAMGGVNLELDIPPNMPPVGVGLAGGNGGARLGIYLPTPVLKTIAAAASQAQGMMGGPADDDEPAPAGNPKSGGQPRF